MKDPTLTGRQGRAWAVPLEDPPSRTEQTATVACWLVEANGYHPIWNRWLVSVVHLRDIAGAPAAVKNFDTATHEFSIVALNTKYYATHENIPPKEGWRYLTPADVIQQFAVPADQFAIKLAELSVGSILNGFMSPDQDWRAAWEQAIPKTVECMVSGGKHAIA